METGSARGGLQTYVNGPLDFISDRRDSSFLMRGRFHAFEGPVEASPHLKIALNTGQTGWYKRHSDAGRLDERWRRNGIVVSLPGDAGHGRAPAASMIGIAIDLDALGVHDVPYRKAEAFAPLISRITMDAMAARQIRLLFSGADLHGCSSAWFEHEVDILLRRLSTGRVPAAETGVPPLDERRLSAVLELIEASLDGDLASSEMAAAIEMDPTNFAKAFRSATGLAPFAYLTCRRMEHAKQMLRRGSSVITAAIALNYANPSKFAAAFKRVTGVTPTQWVKALE